MSLFEGLLRMLEQGPKKKKKEEEEKISKSQYS